VQSSASPVPIPVVGIGGVGVAAAGISSGPVRDAVLTYDLPMTQPNTSA